MSNEGLVISTIGIGHWPLTVNMSISYFIPKLHQIVYKSKDIHTYVYVLYVMSRAYMYVYSVCIVTYNLRDAWRWRCEITLMTIDSDLAVFHL